MARKPAPTWATYRDSIGDRSSLFAAIAAQWPVARALYPGCYLDLSPSTAIPDVLYVDIDRRAARYFDTPGLVDSELAAAPTSRPGEAEGAVPRIEFVHADYTDPLPVPSGSFDLLVSLFAGPVWENCRQYLVPGGLLLANSSHGDASLAALDPDLELVAAVQHRVGRYRLDRAELDSYLVPKSATPPDPERIRHSGRGIAYTRPAFAYVFCVRSGR